MGGAGVWQQVLTALQARADADGLIVRDVSVDSTITRAHRHAAVDAAGRVFDASQAAVAVLAAGYRPPHKPDVDVTTASPLPARRCGNRHVAGWPAEG